MTQIQRARSADEYVDLVTQAVFEVDDLHRSMVEGTCQFATGELPFMELSLKYPERLPFARLLEPINATHCEGLDTD